MNILFELAMKLLLLIYNKIKPFGRLVKTINGFSYDLKRYFLYSAWRCNMKDDDERNYNLVKIYHALEKSMCVENRRIDAGWTYAFMLLDILKNNRSTDAGFHDKAAISVLSQFINLEGNENTDFASKIRYELKVFENKTEKLHGYKYASLEDYQEGILENPEKFFFSRYSLRNFKNEVVDTDHLKRAVSLAMKSPSACNRQAWHVYHSDNDEIKSVALKQQSGNRGFGDNIPNLLIIGADLKAFMPAGERYQHWIDGGMFSMSLVYAFHSLGIASCCLNWSVTPSQDKKIRSVINIKDSHTIVMMMAVGWPGKTNKVCASARRPIDQVLSQLSLKNEFDR